MSSTYTSSKRQFQTYGAYRAKLVLKTDNNATTFTVYWHVYAEMQYAWGAGVGIKLSGGDSASAKGALTQSEGGSSSWKTAASVSGHKTFDKKTSSRKVTFKATAYGTSVPGHSAADSGSVSVDHDITIPALDSYTIKYNANGGSGAPNSQTKYHGVAINLRTSKPSRTGYVFVGWGLSSSDTKKNYDPGDRYTANKSDTLYAIWKRNSWTVTYNANGGKNSGSKTQDKIYNTTLKLFQGGNFSRTGYTLIGWATSPNGGVKYKLGGSYTSNANETLYAVWKAKSYTVSYKLNGGDTYHSSQSKTHGKSLKLYADTPKRTNYKFLYWKGSDGKKYKVGDTYTGNKALTLTAMWELNVNTMIVWMINSSSGEYVKTQQKLTIGKNYVHILPDIANQYGFIGWSNKKEEIQPYTVSDTKFSKKITVPEGNVSESKRTLYAVYKDISPSNLRVINTSAIRVNSSDGTASDFPNYINAIERHESYTSIISATKVIFGYIELSGSATQISTVNIGLQDSTSTQHMALDATIGSSRLGNHVYFNCVLSQFEFESSLSYAFDIELIDNLGKPLITTISIQKIASIFDLTVNKLTKRYNNVNDNPEINYEEYPLQLGPLVNICGTTVDDSIYRDSFVDNVGGKRINLLRTTTYNETVLGGYEGTRDSTYIFAPSDKNINLGSNKNPVNNVNAYGNLRARQNVYAYNRIFGEGHTGTDGYIGWYGIDSRTGISVGSSTSYSAFNLINGQKTLHLSPGVYILHASVYFPTSSNTASSRRGIALGYASSAAYASMNVENGVTAASRLESVCMFAPAENKPVYVYLFQNSGATIQNCNIYWRVVRII